MKKIILAVIIVVSLFNLSGTAKSTAPGYTVKKFLIKSPTCGPFITLENPADYVVNDILVVDETHGGSFHIPSPTFPSNIPGPLTSATYLIKVFFASPFPAGSVNAQNSNGDTLDCNTFTHIGSCAVEFATVCDLYTVNITDVNSCN